MAILLTMSTLHYTFFYVNGASESIVSCSMHFKNSSHNVRSTKKGGNVQSIFMGSQCQMQAKHPFEPMRKKVSMSNENKENLGLSA